MYPDNGPFADEDLYKNVLNKDGEMSQSTRN